MKAKSIIFVFTCICLFGSNLFAFDTKTQKLSSPDEINNKYAIWYLDKDQNENKYFIGIRKNLNNKYGTLKEERMIYRFDRAKLEVSLVISPEQIKVISGSRILTGLSVDSSGQRMVVGVGYMSERGFPCDISFIDTSKNIAERILSDGEQNYNPHISPDGRRVAYFSTDPRAANEGLSTPVNHSAGRVMDITTKEVKTITPYFTDKNPYTFTSGIEWLDNDHVFFHSLSTDENFIKEIVKSDDQEPMIYKGVKYCPYVAVASVSTNETKILAMPGGHVVPQYIMDREGKRFYFSEVSNEKKQVIIKTDFNLENPQTIVDRDSQKKIYSMKLQNGKLIYCYGNDQYEIPK